MHPLKKLVSQTAIYGVSSIFGRFLNYLLVPLFTYYFSPLEYGVVSEFYAYTGFLAVVLIFGLETGYFRFRDTHAGGVDVTYSTALRFLLLVNLGFFAVLWLLDGAIAGALHHPQHPEYVLWMAAILALDSVAAIAFARLRADNRAGRFVAIKLIEILVTVAANVFFIVYAREAHAQDPHSLIGQLWDPAIGVGYIFIANLIGSAVKWLLLIPQWRGIGAGFDAVLFRRMMRYSLPMVAIGLAGVANEMLDRAMMKYLLPGDMESNLAQLGIYSACYKLSILMTLFIQAFRYAGEPFFFAYAKNKDARQIYAELLNYFVIFCVFIFLLVTLYLDIFKYFIGAPFRAGLAVVPILLLANLFLGIYVNLSVWYKLTDRTLMGAYVAGGGALLTVGLNLWWMPIYGIMGAAWATLVCYAAMAVLSYGLGRTYYPVPYDLKRVFAYIGIGGVFYALHEAVNAYELPYPLLWGTALLLLYLVIVYAAEIRPRRRRTP